MGPVQLPAATLQATDKSGLKSPFVHASADPAWSWTTGPAAEAGDTLPADSARQAVLAGRLQRACAGLLARIPQGDAIALASLAATGRATWPQIHAALDARLKRATLAAFGGGRPEESGRSVRERAIWARYDAACTRLFADETEPADSKRQAHAALLIRERKLDILRAARDTALAELTHGAATAAHASPEDEAIDTLEAAGFTASDELDQLIADLAREIAGGATMRSEQTRTDARLLVIGGDGEHGPGGTSTTLASMQASPA